MRLPKQLLYGRQLRFGSTWQACLSLWPFSSSRVQDKLLGRLGCPSRLRSLVLQSNCQWSSQSHAPHEKRESFLQRQMKCCSILFYRTWDLYLQIQSQMRLILPFRRLGFDFLPRNWVVYHRYECHIQRTVISAGAETIPTVWSNNTRIST